MVTGDVIYPRRPDLAVLNFWQCSPCGSYVGCHKSGKGYGDGTRPLGGLANASLRRARHWAHSVFDLLWREQNMSRTEAYFWLARELGLSVEQTHIGEFDEAMCQRVVSACSSQPRKPTLAAPEDSYNK